MAILRLSTQMKRAWTQGLCNVTDHSGGSYKPYTWNAGAYEYVYIWAGTLDDWSTSTLLMDSFVYGTTSTDGNNEIITYSTSMDQASISGTATWFSMGSSNSNFWVSGTIGTDGSGADLVIGNTTLVANQQYIIGGIKVKFNNAI